MMRIRWQLFVVAVAGCSQPSRHVTTTNAESPTARTSSEIKFAPTERASQVTCPDAAVRVDGTWLCPDEAKQQGLIVVDLQDAWAPRILAGEAGMQPDFRAKYLALAQDKDLEGKPLPHQEELAELYGLLPSLAIVRTRLADDARHACNAAIDSSAIGKLEREYGQAHGDHITGKNFQRVALEKQLEAARQKANAPDIASLAAQGGAVAAKVAKWQPLAAMDRGIRAAQAHLACESFLETKYADGTMTWRTGAAIEFFQRRNFLMPNARLDAETREAMQLDSQELDYRLALRILRERVVDATGLIEDGTAGAGPQAILGRMLDPAPMRAARGGEKPLPDGAPDLVSPATEAAAKALGWNTAGDVRAWLDAHPQGVRVAMKLPAVPAYHSAHMDLSAEIDRGDVWYDDTPIPRNIRQRPTMVLSVNDNGVKRPLVRWPSTIGGWSDVKNASGHVMQKWKESDVGPRVWRNVFAAPTWLPPPSTPDRDLVKNTYGPQGWQLKTSIMGPGPHAAFGLVLLTHDNVVNKSDGTVQYWDNGIGTHGSASVTSIVNGTSHGCHRLYNQLAIRLANYLLVHRTHVVKGQTPERYRRQVRYKGNFLAKVDTRGFLYEMTPPVPVNVTKGNIKTARKVPPRNSAPAD